MPIKYSFISSKNLIREILTQLSRISIALEPPGWPRLAVPKIPSAMTTPQNIFFTVSKACTHYFIPFQVKCSQTILSSAFPSLPQALRPLPRPLPSLLRIPKLSTYREYRRRKMEASTLPLEEEEERRSRFRINDNVDLLVEILGRLDGRSLGVAACVCRLWSTVCRRDSVWEALCNRHVAGGGGGPGTRSVVAALGGYRRLYRLCVGPALDRLAAGPGRTGCASAATAAHLSLSLSLSLSLFSIDCYERLGGPQASLLFLRKPVNVS